MAPYREAALVPVEVPARDCTGVAIGGGRLLRIKSVGCRAPGFWSRLWHRVATDDVWACAVCARRFRWTGYRWELFA